MDLSPPLWLYAQPDAKEEIFLVRIYCNFFNKKRRRRENNSNNNKKILAD
jgi:hypothetical protein